MENFLQVCLCAIKKDLFNSISILHFSYFGGNVATDTEGLIYTFSILN